MATSTGRFFAVGVGCGAVLAAAWLTSSLLAPPLAGHAADGELRMRLEALEHAVARLGAAPAETAPAAATTPAPAVAARAAERTDSIADAAPALLQRVERLEDAIQQLARKVDGDLATLAFQQTGQDAVVSDAERKVLAERVILDPQATIAAKLRMHESLRGVPDAYTPPMVESLVAMGLSDPSWRVRADVWRCFDGKSAPRAIVPALLRAIASDAEAYPREEAAETLGHYDDDPAVIAALRHAAANDGNDRVREKAKRTLANIERRAAAKKGTK